MGGIDGWGIGGFPDFDEIEKSNSRFKIRELEEEIKSLKKKLRQANKKIREYKAEKEKKSKK